MGNDFSIVEGHPGVDCYNQLRLAVGWGVLDHAQAEEALRNSLFLVHAVKGSETIGFARLVGDGAVYFYVQDMMVLPAWQRRGVGKSLMRAVIGFLQKKAPQNSFIGLMAAAGMASFYEKHGIPRRAGDAPGMGAWKNQNWSGPKAI